MKFTLVVSHDAFLNLNLLHVVCCSQAHSSLGIFWLLVVGSAPAPARGPAWLAREQTTVTRFWYFRSKANHSNHCRTKFDEGNIASEYRDKWKRVELHILHVHFLIRSQNMNRIYPWQRYCSPRHLYAANQFKHVNNVARRVALRMRPDDWTDDEVMSSWARGMSSFSDVFLSLALFHDLVTIVVIAYSVLTLYDLESDYVNARSVVYTVLRRTVQLQLCSIRRARPPSPLNWWRRNCAQIKSIPKLQIYTVRCVSSFTVLSDDT